MSPIPPQQSLALMDISVERNAYGRQIDSAIRTGPTKLPGGPLEMVYIRAPRIASVGPGVEVMAERDGFPVLVRQGRLLAATFHPELSSDRRVHQLFVDMVREQRDRNEGEPFRPHPIPQRWSQNDYGVHERRVFKMQWEPEAKQE
jgi:glutamine amidotransferase PdxT